MITANNTQPITNQTIIINPDEAAAAPLKKVRNKLTKLDAIRGFAAFYVLCHHTLLENFTIAGREFNLFRFAQEAVILFFILSGFVIQYAYLTSSNKSFKSFFLKRFLRIYIPLVLVFIANYIMLSISAHHLITINGKELTGNLLMIQSVDEIWHHPVLVKPFLANMPLWTLAFEWWFYMIFFFVFNQFGNKTSRVVYIAGIIAALTYLFYPFFVNREIMYLAIWWSGADVAKLYINKQEFNLKNLKNTLLTLSVILVILVINAVLYKTYYPTYDFNFSGSPLIEIRHFLFTIVALIAAVYWKKINWKGFRYTFGLFQPLAAISFTLYISHWFLVSHVTYLDTFIGNYYLKTLIYFIICCAFCYWVECIIYPNLSKRILTYFSVKRKPFATVD